MGKRTRWSSSSRRSAGDRDKSTLSFTCHLRCPDLPISDEPQAYHLSFPCSSLDINVLGRLRVDLELPQASTAHQVHVPVGENVPPLLITQSLPFGRRGPATPRKMQHLARCSVQPSSRGKAPPVSGTCRQESSLPPFHSSLSFIVQAKNECHPRSKKPLDAGRVEPFNERAVPEQKGAGRAFVGELGVLFPLPSKRAKRLLTHP